MEYPLEIAETGNDEEQENDEPIRDVITHNVASDHFEDLKLFFFVNDDLEMMDLMNRCQHQLESRRSHYKMNMTQKTMTDFFKPTQI